MSFTVTPITDIPAPTPQNFPNFVQYQQDGENLGLPDADTLNFAAGLQATRGVGENSNVVTVIGSAPPPGVLELTSTPDPSGPIMYFDDQTTTNIWPNSYALVQSTDWEWSQMEEGLIFLRAGFYQVTVTSHMEGEMGWPEGATTYGSQVGISVGAHARFRDGTNPNDTRGRMIWTDQHFLNILTDGEVVPFGLFASAENTLLGVLFAGMTATIVRLSDPY